MTAHRYLEELATALDVVDRHRVDTSEARDALSVLRDSSFERIAEQPDLLEEVDAIATRLKNLANSRPDDAWQMSETAEQAAAVLREITAATCRRRLKGDSSAALDSVERALAGLPESDLAKLVGAPADGITAWRETGVPTAKAARVKIASLVLLDLTRSMSGEEAVDWFSAHLARLDGQTPLEVLDVGNEQQVARLLRLAQTPPQRPGCGLTASDGLLRHLIEGIGSRTALRDSWTTTQ